MQNILSLAMKSSSNYAARSVYLVVVIFFYSLIPQKIVAQVLCHPQLVWHDEFNTPGDLSKWRVYEGDGCNEASGCGFGNAELQLFKAANAVVADTSLTIFTKYETVVNPVNNKTYKYTSAKLLSKVTGTDNLQTFLFGRIEARIKLPSAGGAWPAFWMLSENGGWPNTGEIDIMEAKHKNPSDVNGTIHYAYPAGVHQYSGAKVLAGTDLSAGYHIYAVEWSPYKIDWYIDDSLYVSQTPATTVGASWPFDASKMYIILNVAVGGPQTPYTGKIAPVPADYPASMKVDYVRVYSGAYNYAVYGKNQVYPNETFQDYRIDSIAGASYNWTVPAGASIVSGQGTNIITVNWGTTEGNVNVAVNTAGCSVVSFSRKVTFKQPMVADKVYDDFEANRIATYGPYTGTLLQAVANPAPGRINTSSLVGKYTRNAASQYDNIYLGSIPVTNAQDFVDGKKKLVIDVYTNAPIGSEITMQLENTSLSSVNPYPSGRHSKYVAYTTRLNGWETLEFNRVDAVIANSATGIFAIDKIALLMEPNKYTGSIYYFDNVRLIQQPSAKWQPIASDTLENYDGISRLVFDTSITSGVYTPNITNPSAGGINTSAGTSRYVRNASAPYDVLFFKTGATIPNAAPFKAQTYQIRMDVYTSAPIGTEVSINLQNNAKALLAFPSGRNSSYQAITTKQNQWETLTFYYSSAPNGATNFEIDQLAILFSPNKPVAQTYYIDNIRIAQKVVYSGSDAYEDYESTHLFTYHQSNGRYRPDTANPAPNGVNSSLHTARYARDTASAYDILYFNTTAIRDGEQFKQGARLFAMDVYTTAPVGTLVSWQLENSLKTNATNYPKGRQSNYQAKITQTNAWHTIYFYLESVPDASTTDNEIDHIAVLFAANTKTGDIYYIDNLRAINGTTSESGLPAPWQHKDIGAVAAAGDAGFSNNVFTVKGSGADIWNAADEFHYVYQPFSGDGQIIVRVDSLGNTNAAAKACVMFRETLDANATEVNALVKAGGGMSISYRSTTAGTTSSVNSSGNAPKWLKMVRAGNVFTSSRSDDGVTWVSLGGKTVAMATGAFIGFGTTSHNDGVITTAKFSNVSVTGTGGLRMAVSPEPVTEPQNNAGIKLYPNPAQDQLTIQWAGTARQLLIHDVSGRRLYQKQPAPDQHTATVSLQGWYSGVYLLSIMQSDGPHIIKFNRQ